MGKELTSIEIVSGIQLERLVDNDIILTLTALETRLDLKGIDELTGIQIVSGIQLASKIAANIRNGVYY